ncbi:MAG: YncE family protein [Acidobacteriota bacterium]|nr:YncE family protein [Acidobacteriota bacterium]
MSLFSFPSGQARVRLVQVSAALTIAALVQGCGAGYRPVVTPINPSGPAQQPNGHAVVISNPSTTSNGIATIIDYSGDTIMATAAVGINPIAFSLDQSGSTGYTLNSDGTLTNFPATSNLQEKLITYSTLPAAAKTVNIFTPSAGMWAANLNNSVADVLTGSPETFKLAIPVAQNPIAIVGTSNIGQRNYAISQGATSSPMQCNLSPTSGPIGTATALEIPSYTVSASIPVGRCPVFAVQSPDGQRLFVLNRGDDTITVINSRNNTLDACTPFVSQTGRTVTCHPSLPLSTTAGLTGTNVPAVAGPVYAEYNAVTSQLVVADYDGGTVSVIDVSLDLYGNDSDTFGTTYTIPVGNHPASVTALYDGSRAYTANQSDGTLTVVNLKSHSVEKTLAVVGHPRTVVSISNSLYGKVYVASPDSPYLTVISTDQDVVDTTVLVQGNIMDVRTGNQNGISGNYINTSRMPGYGEPCYLPANVLADNGITTPTLAQCQSQTLP